MSENSEDTRITRDRKAEAKAKRLRVKEKMALVARARSAATFRELLQVAQVFCFCSLPYRRTEERTINRSARVPNGDTVHVTFQAMGKGVDLPFGTDRSLLHWMTHRAVMTKSSFIPLSSASEFLRDMGMLDTGPNIQRVREAFLRIASFAISIRRVGAGGKLLLNTNIVESARMPASMSLPDGVGVPLPDEIDDPRNGFQLSPAVFRDFIQWHVPTLQTFIRQTRETPQLQDYMLFLQWRSHIAKADTLIPWNMLREQLWSEDTNLARIREKFHEAVTTLKLAWPGLNARAVAAGLEIGPSREPFLLEATVLPEEKPQPAPVPALVADQPRAVPPATRRRLKPPDPDALAAAYRVMASCGFSDPKLAPIIAAALVARTTSREGTSLEQAADDAIALRRVFVEEGDLLKFVPNPEKYFSQGWCWDWNLWPLDREEVKRRRRARVGSH